jgi:hypothetical protein
VDGRFFNGDKNRYASFSEIIEVGAQGNQPRNDNKGVAN